MKKIHMHNSLKINTFFSIIISTFLLFLNLGATEPMNKNILVSWENKGGYTMRKPIPSGPEMILYDDGTFDFIDVDKINNISIRNQIKIDSYDLNEFKKFLSDSISEFKLGKLPKPSVTDLPLTKITINLNNKQTTMEAYGLIAYLMPEFGKTLNLSLEDIPRSIIELYDRLNNFKNKKNILINENKVVEIAKAKIFTLGYDVNKLDFKISKKDSEYEIYFFPKQLVQLGGDITVIIDAHGTIKKIVKGQ